MNIQVYYGETTEQLSPAVLQEVTITTDIHELFPTGTLELSDLDFYWGSKIQLGGKVVIKLVGERTTTIEMAVLSFRKTSREETAVLDNIVVNLIDAKYFRQVEATAAYRGPVSSIVRSIAKSLGLSKDTLLDIEGGSDASIVRYRIQESESHFLKKILPYSSSSGSPMYCFFDHRGILHMRSLNSLGSAPARYTITALVSADGAISDNIASGETAIPAVSLVLAGNGRDAQAEEVVLTTAKHLQQGENAVGKLKINSAEVGNPLVKTNFPGQSARIFDWHTPPFDALSAAAHDIARRDLEMFKSVVLTGGLSNTALAAGSPIKLRLYKTKSIHDDSYIIKRFTQIFSSSGELCRLEIA